MKSSIELACSVLLPIKPNLSLNMCVKKRKKMPAISSSQISGGKFKPPLSKGKVTTKRLLLGGAKPYIYIL